MEETIGRSGTRWTLVTGASGGIGAELARQAALDGSNVVLVARNLEAMEQVASGFRSVAGIEACCFSQDLSEPDAAVRIHDWCCEHGIDITSLINNAGFGDQAAFLDSDWKRQQDMVQVNLVALMQMCHLFGNDMRRRGQGQILNMSSVVAFMPGPYMSMYYATKGAILQFSEALAYELRGTGVSVTAFCPGPTSTGFERHARMQGSSMFSMHPQSASHVAAAGYAAMRAGKPLAYCSPTTKVANVLARLLPRNAMAGIAASIDKGSCEGE